MESSFSPTEIDMVAVVKNIVDGYRMGPIRALAQEPVQNSKDARAAKSAKIEYKLHSRPNNDTGDNYWLLTITDSGTKGLGGPVEPPSGPGRHGNKLTDEDRWAAWETLGFSKRSKDALGARGQGKSAMLFHSRLPDWSLENDQMIMLYDTLLPDGEYRLGVRYATPNDRVIRPPFIGDVARDLVASSYFNEDLAVDLQLAPLTEIGTRIIIPFLSEEALSSIRSGELHRWLERCWWRAIQTKEVCITIVDEHEHTTSIGVPAWWQSEPWRNSSDSVVEHKNVALPSGHFIKRIVLFYDPSLNHDEIDGSEAQYSGIQVFRQRQWIETMSVADHVPRDKRSGFRGFVEFDQGLDRELKDAEGSQHESFDGRKALVREYRIAVEQKLEEFASNLGWTPREAQRDTSADDRATLTPLIQALMQDPPPSRPTKPEGWQCQLSLQYPDPGTTRVNWGQAIDDVEVHIRSSVQYRRDLRVTLEAGRIGRLAEVQMVGSARIDLSAGESRASFGAFKLIEGSPRDGQISAPVPGKWRLLARVYSGDEEVGRASRSIFVNQDPPEPVINDYRLSVSATNLSTSDRQRLNFGEILGLQVNVTNNSPNDTDFELDVSVGESLLADGKSFTIPAAIPGDDVMRFPAYQANMVIAPPSPSPKESQVALPPGKHFLRADLRIHGSMEPVAHAFTELYVEQDSPRKASWFPFEIVQTSSQPKSPRWQLEGKGNNEWVLYYPREYHLYRDLEGTGSNAFILEIGVEALLEWALAPLAHGDETNSRLLLDAPAPAGWNTSEWGDYKDRLDQLAAGRRAATENGANIEVEFLARKYRECAAMILHMYGSNA